MVLDTSVILAILFDEPERHAFNRLVVGDPVRLLSAVNRVEAAIVVEARKGAAGRTALDRFLAAAEIEIASVTSEQAELACEGFRRYGRGRHPAGLNLGDAFAYALSKATGEPLLFKGGDFAQTDVARVG